MYEYGRYTLLQRHEIDDNYWDRCLKDCPYQLPYAYTWWLDIVSPQWSGFVEASGTGYKAVFPLPRHRKFNIELLRQPVFGHQLGLFQGGASRPDAADLAEVVKHTCSRFAYIDGLALHGASLADVAGNSTTQTNYLIDLQQPYPAIAGRYAGNRRREITRATEAGIKVAKATRPDKMIAVFRQYIEPGIYGIDGSEYPMFNALFDKWQEMDRVTIYEATLDGEWLAGAAILHWHNRLIYIFNASTPEGKRLDALSLLIDRILAEHANSSRPLFFDFEAPASQSVLDYYRRFGGEEENYVKIYQNKLPLPLKVLQHIRKAFVQGFR